MQACEHPAASVTGPQPDGDQTMSHATTIPTPRRSILGTVPTFTFRATISTGTGYASSLLRVTAPDRSTALRRAGVL